MSNSKLAEVMGFPGGSKTRVDKAGDAIRQQTSDEECLKIIDEWRQAHREVLNNFNALLRARVKKFDKEVKVAQRQKKMKTICNKLTREKRLRLSQMDDVAGMRLIFRDTKDLREFRALMEREKRFMHQRHNQEDSYDYIKSPKPDGYRGVHDVYKYSPKQESHLRNLKGLRLELQYRTDLQNEWATTNEIIGQVTNSKPKFKQGDARYQNVMLLASELLARKYEPGYPNNKLKDLNNIDLVQEFKARNRDLDLTSLLRELEVAKGKGPIHGKKNAILILPSSNPLEIKWYDSGVNARKALFDLEKSRPDDDIVLVKADTFESMRTSYKNYFHDSHAFLKLINEACESLR